MFTELFNGLKIFNVRNQAIIPLGAVDYDIPTEPVQFVISNDPFGLTLSPSKLETRTIIALGARKAFSNAPIMILARAHTAAKM